MQWFGARNKNRADQPQPPRWGPRASAIARWVATSVFAVSAVYALALAYEGMGTTCCAGRLAGPLVDNASAERAYDALPRGASASTRLAAARRIVQGDPAYAAGWVEMAYAERSLGRRLTADSARALERSYAVAYFDRRTAARRVRFAFDNWDALSPECRGHALAEARLALADATLRAATAAQLQLVQNPAGRLVARLLLVRAAADR